MTEKQRPSKTHETGVRKALVTLPQTGAGALYKDVLNASSYQALLGFLLPSLDVTSHQKTEVSDCLTHFR